ncbi:hypothetical protein ATCC53582_02778 [Novacetimonas hansenii]|nr:hypothetical protein ATCC53582_02778 [Novacetimonas hansenii]
MLTIALSLQYFINMDLCLSFYICNTFYVKHLHFTCKIPFYPCLCFLILFAIPFVIF